MSSRYFDNIFKVGRYNRMVQYVLYKEYSNKFIGYSDTRKVIHVRELENAHKFATPNEARNARKKASKKMAYFKVYMLMGDGKLEKLSEDVPKRKSFSKEERAKIYRKTKGHCYLCGEFVDYKSFEIEHEVPLSKGGTNDLSNLFCACHICNLIKHDIYPEDFMKRISKIFIYQMQIKHRKHLRWKIAYRNLNRLV